jgi:hypothetical protein
MAVEEMDFSPAINLIKSIREIENFFGLTVSKYKNKDIDRDILAEKLLVPVKNKLQEEQIRKYFPNHSINSTEIGYLGQHPYIVTARLT